MTTGETLPLDFVEIHRPVRRLQARQQGRVLRHRLLGKPEDWQARSRQRQDAQGSGAGGRVWTQVPRYTFEGMDFDETN
jgi:hypothetical protein